MIDRLFKFIYNNFKNILIVSFFIFLTGTIYLFSRRNEDANSFGANMLIEIFIGGLFLVVPILFGIYIVNKGKEIHFYEKIKKLLSTLRSHRENGGIKPLATRAIVMEFSNTVGDEFLKEDWIKSAAQLRDTFGTAKCGLCGLTADTVNDKCIHCKLNCFAWS